MQPKFGDRINLLLTDTDSFVFHIQSENVLQAIKPNIQTHFDTSNFPPDHFMYNKRYYLGEYGYQIKCPSIIKTIKKKIVCKI